MDYICMTIGTILGLYLFSAECHKIYYTHLKITTHSRPQLLNILRKLDIEYRAYKAEGARNE